MKNTERSAVQYIFLILAGIIALYPFYWVLVGATLTNSRIFSVPPKLGFGSNLVRNYQTLVDTQPIWEAFKNSVVIATVYTVLTVYISGLAGYAFAKYTFKGKRFLFSLILISMMLPLQVTLIPLFKIAIALGWVNSAKAIVIPALANAFGVFFMRQNMLSVPNEIIESGRVDGASELGIFHRLVLPISLPSLAALGILSFIAQWGNFLWPLIILNDRKYATLPVLLSSMMSVGYRVDYGAILVAAALSILPVLVIFLFLQKYFVAGLFQGAVKS